MTTSRWKRLRLRAAFKDLARRSHRKLVSLLLDQIDATIRGAHLAKDAAAGDVSTEDARTEIGHIEHVGDSARRDLVHELSHVLVTPFDREDMFRLSRAVDDILDGLQDFVRELDLFEMNDKRFVPVIDELTDALALLRQAIESIASSPTSVIERALLAKKSCNHVRRTYQETIAELFRGEVTVEMFQRRELLRRLDVIGLRLNDAVDTLADGAIKRAT